MITFSLLISKVVITTGIFEGHKSIYLFAGNLRWYNSLFSFQCITIWTFASSVCMGYVFTEVMCQVTKYWRQKGIRIVLSIRWAGWSRNVWTALKDSQQVKSDLISRGFTPNQKSVSIPTLELLWLDHFLNFREATIAVTQKILKLKQDISFAVSLKIVKAQKLAGWANYFHVNGNWEPDKADDTFDFFFLVLLEGRIGFLIFIWILTP